MMKNKKNESEYLKPQMSFVIKSVQLNAQVNDSLLFASRYLVPRRVSRECVCVCEGNLV